jgi:Subtilase family
MPLPGRHTQGVTTVTRARSTRRPSRSAAATTTLGVLLALSSVLVSALALAAPAQAAGTGHVRLPARAKLAHACAVTSTTSFHTTTRFRCFADRRTDIAPLPRGTTTSASFKAARAAAGYTAAVTPPGLHPADLTAAYQLPSSTRGVGQTVYIVDAYNYPNAESDLAVYRAQYGLPACTTANGCFRQVNQNGLASPLPATDNGWAAEMALDLDMVSAVCPNCNITLVEANDASGNMMTAVARANTMGAKFVSMSWGGVESKSAAAYDAAYFKSTGVVYTASSGDSGFNGALYPASSNRVVAVGGTSLTRASNNRGWTESAWSGAGSGCSGVEDRPAWQSGNPGCTTRAFTDISAVADPSTGVSVYVTTGGTGWSVYGGTSASSPIIAAAFALAGPPASGSKPAQTLYSHRSRLNDVTTGSNGSCSPSVLCHATTGWDGPTGLGTPSGIGAFSASRGTRPAGVMGRYFSVRPVPVIVNDSVRADR